MEARRTSSDDGRASAGDDDDFVETFRSNRALISCAFAREHADGLTFVDASWHMPDAKRSGRGEYMKSRLRPETRFLDVDAVSDRDARAPHQLPAPEAFEAAMEALRLKRSDNIVVYDRNGMFSAARAWWMFRAHGWDNVRVLDGGAPAWRAAGYDEDESAKGEEEILAHIDACAAAMRTRRENEGEAKSTDFKGTREELVKTKADVLKNLDDRSFQVVDARGAARFRGETKEPREGVRSGHIPGSRNVFFGELLDDEKKFKSIDEMRRTFEASGLDLSAGARPIVASCGTGVTACIVALGLHRCGVENVAVYDGSWTEYGIDPECPLATGHPE
ncbi:Thiosulphate sulfurtransferase, conserved site [Ostreococcus tauri]|uniref:Sulfurtransferase n=1 Tax=Ostreococcus tauri TaxID=70448 RepID=Q00VJ9_OSTTA|nr:Thiosulphate sulfurtransferase, conserved site [Ostreococcus tauri]CAL57428.1 Thiosulphate sulfurtransferase, conserved site [Ostreococcus tauri]|eukprot:XP_003083153.1 Thiosulphate sulfurtransferase, conserved site [Ostreococcus tauri]